MFTFSSFLTRLLGRCSTAGICAVPAAICAAALAVLAMSTSPAGAWTPVELDALERISQKLSSITTMNGEFVQTGPNGGIAEGNF